MSVNIENPEIDIRYDNMLSKWTAQRRAEKGSYPFCYGTAYSLSNLVRKLRAKQLISRDEEMAILRKYT